MLEKQTIPIKKYFRKYRGEQLWQFKYLFYAQEVYYITKCQYFIISIIMPLAQWQLGLQQFLYYIWVHLPFSHNLLEYHFSVNLCSITQISCCLSVNGAVFMPQIKLWMNLYYNGHSDLWCTVCYNTCRSWPSFNSSHVDPCPPSKHENHHVVWLLWRSVHTTVILLGLQFCQCCAFILGAAVADTVRRFHKWNKSWSRALCHG